MNLNCNVQVLEYTFCNNNGCCIMVGEVFDEPSTSGSAAKGFESFMMIHDSVGRRRWVCKHMDLRLAGMGTCILAFLFFQKAARLKDTKRFFIPFHSVDYRF
jgi:hypothetical protein